jgi:putative FmdB family regulatory protein
MPTYEYVCRHCGHKFEELQSFKEPELLKCPECHQDTLARIMGGGGGLIFKGSGFYLTDYAKKDEKKSPSPTPKTTEAKPEAGSTPPPADSKPSSPSPDTKKE